MKILIFNLADIENPDSGGAEVFTHQVARRWVKNGNQVTMIASKFSGGETTSVIDGVRIIRVGGKISVFWRAKKYYLKNLKCKFDVILDEYSFRPFLTPKYAKEPIVFLAHELAREKYFYALPPLVSQLFYYYLEPKWIRTYRNNRVITVSESTKNDLANFGLDNVTIVPEGFDFDPVDSIPEKDMPPKLLFVGLIKRVNLVEDAIKAFMIIRDAIPGTKISIVGRGPNLLRIIKKYEDSDINFHGYVSDEEKIELMKKAHILLVPAIREGWGLVVTEANACGTPAIGYNVPGLRDSIRNEITGLITKNDPQSLGEAAIALLRNDNKRREMSRSALIWSRTFNWDRTADEMLEVLKGTQNVINS